MEQYHKAYNIPSQNTYLYISFHSPVIMRSFLGSIWVCGLCDYSWLTARPLLSCTYDASQLCHLSQVTVVPDSTIWGQVQVQWLWGAAAAVQGRGHRGVYGGRHIGAGVGWVAHLQAIIALPEIDALQPISIALFSLLSILGSILRLT